MTFTMFPLALSFKLIFPFFHPAIVYITFALFVMNLMGTHRDLLGDVKSVATKLRTRVSTGISKAGASRRLIKTKLSEIELQKIKDKAIFDAYKKAYRK